MYAGPMDMNSNVGVDCGNGDEMGGGGQRGEIGTNVRASTFFVKTKRNKL